MAGSDQEQLGSEAAAWLAKFQRADLDPSGHAAFEAWIDADPRRAVAYARVEAAWERAERLKAQTVADGSAEPFGAEQAPHAVPLVRSDRRPPVRITRRAAAASIIGVAAAGAGAALWTVASPTQAYATAVGERKSIALPDGSRVDLNTDSKIEVRYTDRRRSVRLARGEALFSVANDAGRPFEVETRRALVRGDGSRFNVRLRRDLVEVSVAGGAIQVAQIGPASGAVSSPSVQAANVAAGSGVVIGDGAIDKVALTQDVLGQRLAWRDGVIELHGETLEQAVEEFNRYRQGKLVIGDARLASIRVGGRFEIDESDKFLNAVKVGFRVKTVPGEGGKTYLLPAA